MTPVLDAVRREELRKRAVAALAKGWHCPFCSCQTFARCDELGQHGYAPGDNVRCVSCKHEFYWPRFNETADATLALLAYIAELEAEAAQFQEAAGQQMVRAERLEDQLDRVERERDELRAGLRPFAEAADSLDEQRRDTSEIWEDPAAMAITAGDLRRAAALLPKASVREERPKPGLIRICPERDGVCPHGLDCPYAIDRGSCDIVASRRALSERSSK